MNYRKYIINESFFEKINEPVKAYWLGFIYADGHNTEGKLWRLSLHLNQKDIEHLIKFRDIIYPNKDKKIEIYKNSININVFSKKMSLDLIKLGVVNKKSLTIKFPTKNIVPNRLLIYFIQGLFDGDGSVSITKNNTPSACLDFCGSLSLIKELKRAIKKYTGIEFGYKERTYKNTIGVTYIKGNDVVLKFLDWLYKDPTLVLKRKYQKYMDIKEIKKKVIENKSSKYRGVYIKRNYPHAQIQIGTKVYRLGRFKTEKEAAKAYNDYAIKLFGEKAKLNKF
jgi:hypothetical protein